MPLTATVAQEAPQQLPPLKGQPLIPRLDLPAIKAPMVVAKPEHKGQKTFSSSDDDSDDDDSDFH